MTGRTFKCYSHSLELRAYLPNRISVGQLPELAELIAVEMGQALYGSPLRAVPVAELKATSNRAGLHLAYSVELADLRPMAVRLIANGWKECQGE